MYVEYSANNSGGSWWLTDKDWKALEKAGWKVAWASLAFAYDKKGEHVIEKDGTPKLIPVEEANNKHVFSDKDEHGVYRYLGALAQYAYRVGLHLREAADEWERVTGKSSTDAGCACCGQPHNFTEYDDKGKYVDSGPHASYEAHW